MGTSMLCNELCGEIPDLGVAVSEFYQEAKTVSQTKAVLLSGLLLVSGGCSGLPQTF